MAAPERVGVAMVGTGFIADYHLAALARCAQAAPRVVVGRDAARARALADRFAVADAVGVGTADAPTGPVPDALAHVLARRDVDAVIVATPDDTHEAIALAAIAARKAVLLQKPMASDSAACGRIIAAAEAAGVDLQVSFMHRHFPEVQLARRLLAEEAIGTVHSLRVRNATPGPDWADWFFAAERVAGGVVHQLGVHGIDLALQLLGPIREVSARTATLQPERRLASGRVARVHNPDSAWATYGFVAGAMGNHEMSMLERQGCDRFRLELYGSDGTIWLRSERGPCAVHAPRWLDHDGWWLPALADAPFGKAHHERWLAGITGREPRERTARDALAGMQVAEAIARSAAAGGTAENVIGADDVPMPGTGADAGQLAS